MNTSNILQLIDDHIATLKQARAVLTGTDSLTHAPIKKRKRNTMSPEGRARIAAAVKARWAKQKKAV